MTKQEKIERLKTRLELYYKREEEMLSGGVQSYGIGTRNASRYQTDLNAVKNAIEDLEKKISELEHKAPRKAMNIIPRD